MMQITQLRDKCIGCNACVEAAAYRWRISTRDGKCTLIGAKEKKGCFTINVSDDEWDDHVIAAKNCPVNIIKLKKL